MMKRFILFLLLVTFPLSVYAGLADDPETVDGLLAAGEYVSSVWLESNEELVVMGGGAFRIETWDNSYLEVQYTSTPLSNSSGIYDIMLSDNSKLLYLDGITEEITLKKGATAILKGGRIDGITLYRRPQDSTLVTIYCQEGYQMNQSGISGLWENGTSFDIEFIDVSDPFPATWNYINVEIVPEPTTLALLGIGGLLIRRKQ